MIATTFCGGMGVAPRAPRSLRAYGGYDEATDACGKGQSQQILYNFYRYIEDVFQLRVDGGKERRFQLLLKVSPGRLLLVRGTYSAQLFLLQSSDY